MAFSRMELLSENAGGQLTNYSWEAENRLTGVAYPTGAPDTMTYSNDGLRQKKVTAAGTTDAVWDEQNLLQEKDGGGVTQAQYSDHPGYWGGLASQRRSGDSSFFAFDQQANARLLASASGAQTDVYQFKAFGEELAVSGSTLSSLRFGGKADTSATFPIDCTSGREALPLTSHAGSAGSHRRQ